MDLESQVYPSHKTKNIKKYFIVYFVISLIIFLIKPRLIFNNPLLFFILSIVLTIFVLYAQYLLISKFT